MKKISIMDERDLNLKLYAHNLRDFCNKDLRIVREKDRLLFISKHEKICFRVVEIPHLAIKRKVPIGPVILYMIADEIFAEIIDLRNENEIF